MSNKTLGKPEPHSDVINKEPKTLLIGYGWVGQYVHEYFTQADYYSPSQGLCLKKEFSYTDPETGNEITHERFAAFEKLGKESLAGEHWDVAFVSVPSPMNSDGSCNVKYVVDAVDEWQEFVDLFIIRSTVEPGTIDHLQKKYPEKLFVMQPEYVGETKGHPMLRVNFESFIILGGKPEATRLAAKYWSKVLHPASKIRQVDAKTAEFCKYMENCFLATKVIFVNDWRRLCEASGVDYMTLREIWLDDPRIGPSHTFAYPENPGFSGKCLPKDLNAIVYWARYATKQPLELIESLLRINFGMRKGIKNTVPLLPEKGDGNGPFDDINRE